MIKYIILALVIIFIAYFLGVISGYGLGYKAAVDEIAKILDKLGGKNEHNNIKTASTGGSGKAP